MLTIAELGYTVIKKRLQDIKSDHCQKTPPRLKLHTMTKTAIFHKIFRNLKFQTKNLKIIFMYFNFYSLHSRGVIKKSQFRFSIRCVVAPVESPSLLNMLS